MTLAASRTNAWLTLAGVLLCMVLYVSLTLHWVWREVPVDDAFIVFRYADRFVAGDGLVFNPGERVEGYSSLAWTLLIALLRALGADAAQSARGLGLVLGLATVALIAGWPETPWNRLFALSAFATSLPAIYHFVNGLETALMAFLVTALARLNAAAPTSERSRWSLAGQAGVSALLSLTRPEGAACVLLFAVAVWSGSRGTRTIRNLVWPVGGALLAAGAQLVFRVAYYGDWMANSARAKLLPLSAALPQGLESLFSFASYTSAWGLLVAGWPLAWLVSRLGLRQASSAGSSVELGEAGSSESRGNAWFLLLTALLLAQSGGDCYPLWRFFVPLLPLACLLAARGWGQLSACIGPARQRRFGYVACLLWLTAARWSANQTLAPTVVDSWRERWTAIGVALAQRAPPDATLALCPIGRIPYLSGLRSIDMLGLTEPAIARTPPDLSYAYPGHQRHAAAHVLDRKPDLIMLANGPVVARPDVDFPWSKVRVYERDFVTDPRFARDYTLAHLPLPSGGFVQLFARKTFLGR